MALAVLLLATPASAQQQAVTLDDIYHPDKKVDFEGAPPKDLVWIDDAHYLWMKPASGETRKRTTCANSSGSQKRPTGICLMSAWRCASVSCSVTIGVFT